MITEDYVSFETAKLLKEKGFENDAISCINVFKGHIYKIQDRVINADDDVTIPTIQMAIKWLRKVHGLFIMVWILTDEGYWFNIEKILNTQYKHKPLYSTGEDIYFDTYEEACEAAIKYCLENLI